MFTAAESLCGEQAFFDRDTPIGLRQRAIIKTASSYEPPNPDESQKKMAALKIKAAEGGYFRHEK